MTLSELCKILKQSRRHSMLAVLTYVSVSSLRKLNTYGNRHALYEAILGMLFALVLTQNAIFRQFLKVPYINEVSNLLLCQVSLEVNVLCLPYLQAPILVDMRVDLIQLGSLRCGSSSLGSQEGKPGSTYGWSGVFSSGSPVFAHL